MIDLKKVQDRILEATAALGRENVPLLDGVGRVLAYDIQAVEDLPASDISAMDGYAVRSTCLNGASSSHPVQLKIIGESAAGRFCSASLGEREAVRIMTGALLPAGADTVVKIETTCEKNGVVFCKKNPGYGAGIRFRGDTLKRGETVLTAGQVITAPVVGTLASLRRAYVYVHRKPVVAIISTGDELSDFHEPPLPGKTMCSNVYALAARVLESGGRPLCLGIVRDDLQEICSLLEEALHADVIITSGGTSKGRYDLVHKAFSILGLEVRFSNIFDKPGKPTVFGTVNQKLFFGLPGNPTANMLSFGQFIKPALLKMMGHRTISCQETEEAFSAIDSFNYSHGGNNRHKKAPLIPLEEHCRKAVAAPGNRQRKPGLKLAAR